MQRRLHAIVIIVIAFLVAAPALRAELISPNTEAAVIADQGARDAVSAHLVARGASPPEAAAMVERMTVEEVVYFDADPSRSQPGGDALVTVLVIVALVVLIIVLVNNV